MPAVTGRDAKIFHVFFESISGIMGRHVRTIFRVLRPVYKHTKNREGSPLGMPSLPQPSSTQLDTKAFQMTVSTKGDLSAESQDLIENYLKKNTLYSYACIETGGTGKRHLHALMIFKESRSSKKIHENVWDRFVKKQHPDSIGRIAVKVQVCPGNDWYTDYLQKEPERELLHNRWDPVAAQEFFPSPEVQETLMALHEQKSKKSCNEFWDRHVTAWVASPFTDTPDGALCYFKQCWLDGTSPRITDPRRSTQMARGLYEHRHRIVTCTEREQFLLKQLEEGPSYEVPASIQGERFSSARPGI